MKRFVICSAGFLGFVSVVLGAAGAHFLRESLTAQELSTFETAVRYQLFHAVALLALLYLMQILPGRLSSAVAIMWTLGALIFSGSLYAIVFTGVRSFGAVAPIGGLSLMAGWVCVFILGLRATR